MPIRTKGTKAPNWSKEEDEILLEMMANQADYMKFMEGQNYSQLDIYRALSMEFHKRSGVMRAPGLCRPGITFWKSNQRIRSRPHCNQPRQMPTAICKY